jgi:hypothetical protein
MDLHSSLPERLQKLTAEDFLMLDNGEKLDLVLSLKDEDWDRLWEFAEEMNFSPV